VGLDRCHHHGQKTRLRRKNGNCSVPPDIQKTIRRERACVCVRFLGTLDNSQFSSHTHVIQGHLTID
jgi:hypothetical protein